MTDSYTKLDIGSATKTFVKQHSSTKVKVFLNSLVKSGTFSGADGIRFELRINGNQAPITSRQVVFNSDTEEFIVLKAVFTNLPAGEHNVEVWARGIRGSSTDVMVDPGGWGGRILVTETR